jgi:transporter family protein
MAAGIVFISGKQHEVTHIAQKSWVFLVLSGVATGVQLLFYYKALQLGDVSKVVPVDKFSVVISMVLAFIILGEAVEAKTIIGGVLITVGTLVMIL